MSVLFAPGMLAVALVFPQGAESDWAVAYLVVAVLSNTFFVSWLALGIWLLICRMRQRNSMRIKLDENLPALLAVRLRALGHNVQSVPEERLSGGIDTVIWDACQREERFLITQDLDFSDMRRFRPGTHAGVLLVRLRNASRAALASRVGSIFGQEDVNAWKGCFVVATERKVRIRRPES